LRRSLGQVEEGAGIEASVTESKRKVVERKGDRLGREAVKGGDSSGCRRVVSCSRHEDAGWRTELDLCRGESFDDRHRSAALGTAP